MNFITDKQTLDDLNVFGKRSKTSLFSIFNGTRTQGGAKKLEEMFRYPLADLASINKRIQIIQLFREQQWVFFATNEQFEAAELYLSINDDRTRLRPDNLRHKGIKSLVSQKDANFQIIEKGILSLLELQRGLALFLENCRTTTPQGHIYENDLNELSAFLQLPWWQLVPGDVSRKPSFENLAVYDNLLRFQYRDPVYQMLSTIASIDVYVAVAYVSLQRGFHLPEAVDETEPVLYLKDVYHPELEKPVANSIAFNTEKNLLFLTGANMAGKSTFMKSLGAAVYLAHMGFPVPAAIMKFTVQDGMFSSINLPDNLGMGYSHFYAEVIRVKKIAAALQQGLKIFVLIDELFRGTNVKDAYEATVAVVDGFAKKKQSFFVISTHIMEAGEKLKKNTQINFKFLPTTMKDTIPIYTRILEDGISSDRHGMIIINHEGIIAMLHDHARKYYGSLKPACNGI